MHGFINSALCHLSGIREFLAQVYGVGNRHTAFLTFQLQIATLFSCNSMYTLLKFSHSFGGNFTEGISIQLITEKRQQWKKNGFYFPSWQQIPSHHLPSAGAYLFGTDGPPAAQEIREIHRTFQNWWIRKLGPMPPRECLTPPEKTLFIFFLKHLWKPNLMSTYNQSFHGLITDEQDVPSLIRVKSFLP